MTRINANIYPDDLIDQHLVAEYREIIRIPNTILKNGYNKNKQYPKEFTLGTGHVLYFYDKIKFLHRRFMFIKTIMNRRNIVNNINDDMFIQVEKLYPELYNDIETESLYNANILIIDRIIERVESMKRQPTQYGNHINTGDYIKGMLYIKQVYQGVQELSQ